MPWRELNAGAISGYEVESTVNSNGVRELQLTSRGSSEGWYKLNAEAVSGYNIEINGQDSKGTINFKTDGTLTSRYFPPDNDSVDFQLQSYTAPSNDAADLSLADFGKILIDQSIVTEVTIDGRVTEDLTVEGDTVSSIVDALPAYNSVEDLVLWYRFEDGDARDYATFEYAGDPTAYNGTVSGATYQQFQGVRDFDKGCNSGAYSFDGTDDTIPITNFTYEGPDIGDITVMTWFNTTASDNCIIASYDRSEYWRLEIGGNAASTGSVGMSFRTDSGTTDNFGSSTDVDDGQWHHVAFTYSSGSAKLYLDGTEENSGTFGNYIGNGGTVRYGFIGVGSEADSFNGTTGPDDFFTGNIDDFRIYQDDLTSTEIDQIYQATQP